MKSLFGKPDNNRFSEKLVNNDQQKYINDKFDLHFIKTN
mgnify:CR=1 FL=1